jgi:hypothetical protein
MLRTCLAVLTRLAVVAILGCLTTPIQARPSSEHAAPGISGAWQIEPALSDDAQARLHAALQKRGATETESPAAPGAGSRGGGGHRGSRGGGANPARTDSITAAADDAVAIGDFATAPQQLCISSSAVAVAFKDEAGKTLQYSTTIGWIRTEDGGSVRAQWKNGALAVESRWNAGTTLKTTYEILRESGRLEVVSHLELSSGVGVTARRVYKPSAGP